MKKTNAVEVVGDRPLVITIVHAFVCRLSLLKRRRRNAGIRSCGASALVRISRSEGNWLDANDVKRSLNFIWIKGWVMACKDLDGRIVRLYVKDEEHEWTDVTRLQWRQCRNALNLQDIAQRRATPIYRMRP